MPSAFHTVSGILTFLGHSIFEISVHPSMRIGSRTIVANLVCYPCPLRYSPTMFYHRNTDYFVMHYLPVRISAAFNRICVSSLCGFGAHLLPVSWNSLYAIGLRTQSCRAVTVLHACCILKAKQIECTSTSQVVE
jgi:hypothetical protein